MTTESELLAAIRLECGVGPTRIFRNNTGVGWVGIIIRQTATEITLKHYRPLHAGLCVGSSDLIGWTTRENVAVFAAIEAKASRKLTEGQARFLAAVEKAGGIAGEVRSVEDARRLLAG